MLLIEKSFFLLIFCVSFYESRAQPSVEKVESRRKLHLVSNFTCTREELRNFTSKIEALHGKLRSLDSYIKNGGVDYTSIEDYYSTAGGPAVWADFASEGSKVSFRYIFYPNKRRVGDQCAIVKAYRLKFGRVVSAFNKLKPVVDKKNSFKITDRNGDKKKRYRNNKEMYFTWKDTDREAMEPHKKICTRKVFINPVFAQKVEVGARVKTFFRKGLPVGSGPYPEEYVRDISRNLIMCFYRNAHTRWPEQGYAVAGGRRVQVDYISHLYFYKKELKDFNYLINEEN